MTPYSSQLPLLVEQTIREQELCQADDTLIVALSGGADSTALFDILSHLPGYSLRLIAVHLNHCLRGAESDADEEFCRSLAARQAVEFESRHIDVKALASASRLNLEDAGRQARLDFLEEIRKKYNAAAIAVAHHADDQAETVLMRLLRGSGMTGLSGMSYRNGHGYIRPLLDASRAEIERYLTERGLEWREDASNRDTTFLRNRVRHQLLPLLEQYNPAIREHLTTTAAILTSEDTLLSELTEQAFIATCHTTGRTTVCSIPQLLQQPPALQNRVFRLACERLCGTLARFSHYHIDAIGHLIRSTRPNSRLSLPQGLAAVREYDELVFQLSADAPTEPPGEVLIPATGTYQLANGAVLSVEVCQEAADISSCAEILYLDPLKVPFPWLIRTFRHGDRMTPFGMSGSKKVKEIFRERYVPFSKRSRIPLLFCKDELIWVVGLRASERCRIGDKHGAAIKVSHTHP